VFVSWNKPNDLKYVDIFPQKQKKDPNAVLFLAHHRLERKESEWKRKARI
jgi:hypothetical protein